MTATLAEHGCFACDFRLQDYKGPQQRLLDIVMGCKIASHMQSSWLFVHRVSILQKRRCKGKQSTDGLLARCQKPWHRPVSAHLYYTFEPCVFICNSVARIFISWNREQFQTPLAHLSPPPPTTHTHIATFPASPL